MGGMMSPSAKLINTPPPGNTYPGVAQSFQSMLQTQGPQAGQTLGEAMKTGLPTDVGPAFQAMLTSQKGRVDQGRQNVLESFGQMGMRHSSNAIQGAVNYESQTNKDFAQILADYVRQASEGAAGRKIQASGITASMFGEAGMSTHPTAVLSTGASPFSQGAQAGQAAASIAMMLALM